jgi:hypothetical protein
MGLLVFRYLDVLARMSLRLTTPGSGLCFIAAFGVKLSAVGINQVG